MTHLYTTGLFTACLLSRIKAALVFIFLFISICSAHGQELHKCSAHEIHAERMASDAQYASSHRALEAYTEQYVNEFLQQYVARKTGVITIPVVFHIIHNGEAVGTGANIADAQILSQLQVLNEDMRRTNPDAANTPLRFRSVAADCEVEFCIALQNPQGIPALGINRVNGGQPNWGFQQMENLKPTLAWDPNRYLNIYVADIFTQIGALGFATFPVSPIPLNDGIVCDFRTVGRFPANPFNTFFNGRFNQGRTATHEVGHWLNCFHIWGDDGNLCTGTDNVNDTPNQAGPTPGCPPNTFIPLSCNNAPNGNMFMNYLDGTDDLCQNMYTLGQKARMNATFDFIRTGFVNTTLCNRLFTTTNITAVTATLTWSPWIGAVGYNVRWRIIGGNGIWTNGFSVVNTLNIAGLTPSPNPAAYQFTTYEWQVEPVFPNGTTGGFSASQLFRTLGVPPAVICPYDPNENAIFGPYLVPGGQGQGIICPAADIDRFVIMNNTLPFGNLRLILSNMGADYDFDLRNAVTNTVLASGTRFGLVNDTIDYHGLPPGNYYVYVYAKVPMFVAVMPYTVRMIMVPQGQQILPGMKSSIADDSDFIVYPNPAKEQVAIQLTTELAGTVSVKLIDMAGRTLREFSGVSREGGNFTTFDITGLVSGIYFVKLQTGENTLMKKLLISH